MEKRCEHAGPNDVVCDKVADHDGVHQMHTDLYATVEYGRRETTYRIDEWNDAGFTAPKEYGCSVPVDDFSLAEDAINCILLLDAKRTMGAGKVIEIRATLEKDGMAWFYLPSSDDCPDGFEDHYTMQQEPLFDFDGNFSEIDTGGYLLLARIKLEAKPEVD